MKAMMRSHEKTDPAEAERYPALTEEEILKTVQEAHRELDQKKDDQRSGAEKEQQV